MADDLDEALARHLRQAGLVTPEQLTQAQAESARRKVPLSASLVRLGLLTDAQSDALTKKIRERQDGPRRIGPYAVLRKIGQGGMGAVYLAKKADGPPVALKILPREHAGQEDARKRFRREAETALKLRHPHLVRAIESGEDDGVPWYSMEYVEGGTLETLLAGTPLPPVPRAIDLVLQTARGLEYLHRQDLIHRDVKPANILLGADGTARLLDLGLTKDLAGDSSLRTVTGSVMGTPHYLSPEQARGDKTIDARTDLYSLGVTFYHLLTGRLPFEGTTALEILSKHLHQKLPDPRELRPELPDGVLHVLERMMAKEPKHRHETTTVLIADLEEVAAGRPPKSERIQADLTTIAQRKPVITRRAVASRKKLPVLPLAAAAVVLVGLLAWAVAGRSNPPPPPPPAPPPPVAPAPRPIPPVAKAEVPVGWIELLPMIDPLLDTRVGGWSKKDGALLADGSNDAGCQVPYSPPAEYDLILEFTRKGHGCETGLFVRNGEANVLIGLAGHGGSLSGITSIAGHHYGDNPTKRYGGLEADRRHRADIAVRKDLVTVKVNDVEWIRWTPAMGPLTASGVKYAPPAALLGLANCTQPTVFHRFAILEKTGKGKPGR